MGLLSRLSYTIRSWMNALISQASDPAKELDYSYEQMRSELQHVKSGVADLTTQKKRLERQCDSLQQNAEKHGEQAREAVRQGRDDLARQALSKKQANERQISELTEQIEELEGVQRHLVEKKDAMESQIEQFRTRKETMKARYEAAEASASVNEALTGVGEEMGEVARAIERTTERTEQMEARAAALDELEASGDLESVLAEGDSIDHELDQVASDREVDQELETLRAEVEGREQPPETEPAESEPAAAEPADSEAGSPMDDTAVEAEIEALEADLEEA